MAKIQMTIIFLVLAALVGNMWAMEAVKRVPLKDDAKSQRAELWRLISKKVCYEDLDVETLQALDDCRKPRFVDVSAHDFRRECRDAILGRYAQDPHAINDFEHKMCRTKGNEMNMATKKHLHKCEDELLHKTVVVDKALHDHAQCYAKALKLATRNGQDPSPAADPVDSSGNPTVSDD